MVDVSQALNSHWLSNMCSSNVLAESSGPVRRPVEQHGDMFIGTLEYDVGTALLCGVGGGHYN